MLVSLVSSIPLVGSFGLRLGLGGDLARSEATSPSLGWQLQLGEYNDFITVSLEGELGKRGTAVLALDQRTCARFLQRSPL